MTKDFKKGDKVYWVDVDNWSERKDRTVREVGAEKVYFTNGGSMPVDRVFLSDERVNDNPFKNIKTPIYTLDTISEACFDYMQYYKVNGSSEASTRNGANEGVVYHPSFYEVIWGPMEDAGDGRIKLSKEEFYKAIGFVENNDKAIEKSNIPLFGSELINKYRE